MKAPNRTALFLAVLVFATGAHAGEVFRCESAAGLAFQDSPCPPRQRQTRLHLPTERASVPSVADAAAKPDIPVVTNTQAGVAQAPPPPPAPTPKLTICRAGDGSRYLGANGVGRVNWVPYTVASDYNRSLAEVYGGRDGLASRGPGAANIPHRPASSVAGAGYYVQVSDPCHQATPQEACAFLREQLDGVDARLRQRRDDADAQAERTGLRDQMRGCG